MNSRALYFILALSFTTFLEAKTIWIERNLYAPSTEIRAGDVFIVRVNDISNLVFSISGSTTNTSEVSSEPDATITGFLPKVSARKKVGQRDTSALSGKTKFDLSIAVRVVNPAGAGYAVAGTKTYTINGTTTIITVSGIVIPSAIRGQAIDAANLADMTLEIRTIKQGVALQRAVPGPADKATSTLTEAEKQRIIVDYLNRILSEITK